MQFETWDSHFAWWDEFDPITVDGKVVLAVQTSTHEEYQFDIATGAMTYEWRMWRQLALIARIGTPLLLAVFAVAGFVWMRRRSHREKSLVGIPATSNAAPTTVSHPRQLQFSLKSMFVATAVISAILSISDRYPDALFWAACMLLLFVPAMYWTYATRKRRTIPQGSVFTRRAKKVAWYSAGFLLWIGAYVLSYFPTQSSLMAADVSWDVRVVISESIYRPVVWLMAETSAGDVVHAINRWKRT
jgi:hypothetical protein